jgi:hypothetical protein
LNTTFTILSALKGNPTPSVVLRHHRRDDDLLRGGCLNCGALLNFEASDSKAGCRPGEIRAPYSTTCAYMLFLKRDGAEVFAPTSGQLWPNDSIFRLARVR